MRFGPKPGVPRRIFRAWLGAVAAFFALAIAGAVAIALGWVALGCGLLVAAGGVTVWWNYWVRKKGFY